MTQNSNFLTIESLTELASVRQPVCLSLYQPTHRHRPENQQGPIRFGNLVKDLETSLREQYPAAETRFLLEPFEALAHDQDFWSHTLDGLAVLGRAEPVSSVPASAAGHGIGCRCRQFSHQAFATLSAIGWSLSGLRIEPRQDPAVRGEP